MRSQFCCSRALNSDAYWRIHLKRTITSVYAFAPLYHGIDHILKFILVLHFNLDIFEVDIAAICK